MKNEKLKRLFKKILFLLIITIILWFFKLSFVSAATVDIQLSSFTYNNKNLLNLDWYSIGSGNATLSFDFDFTKLEGNASYLYTSIVLCSDSTYSSSYATDPSEITNIQINNTNYSCAYKNSDYAGGKVVIVTFLAYSSGANSIVIYQNNYASIQLIDFVVDSSGYVNPLDYSSQTLINQNSQIINQNNTIINNGNATNDKLDDLNKNLTDETPPDFDGLKNSAGWLPKGPVDSIINLPLSLLENIQDNLGKTCQPVSLPLPFVNKNISLPCINSLYSQIEGMTTFFNWCGVVASVFILFRYLIYLYNRVDSTLTLRENTLPGYFEDSMWGGM